jgi:hypothetical protein
MMRPEVRAFRDAAIQVCRARNFQFSRYMDSHGLEEILQEAESEAWPAKKIAGQVLLRCCITDGTFNNFYVGLLSVMAFLNNHLGSLGQGEVQAFRDLVDILKAPATTEAIIGWLDTHYQ